MNKKRWLASELLILILLGIIFLPAAGSQPTSFGCCANIDFGNQGYCFPNELTEGECCPAILVNYGTPNYPNDQADCIANYFKSGDCNGLDKCQKGCCLEIGAPDSKRCQVPITEDQCLNIDNALFASTTDPPFGGSLCYSLQPDSSILKKFANCPDKGANTITCSDLNGQQNACKTSFCSFCPSTSACLPDCSTCPETEDANSDGECDGGTPTPLPCSQQANEQSCKAAGCKFCSLDSECGNNCNLCTDGITSNQHDGDNDDVCDNIIETQFCLELDNQNSCVNSDINCFWCENPLPGAGNCRPSGFGCSSCSENTDTNSDKVCDSLGMPPCNDQVDNDADGFTDQEDFCCDNTDDLTEDNNCFCPTTQVCSEYGIQQCLDGAGSRIATDKYNAPNPNHICCSEKCFMPPCPTNQRVSTFKKGDVPGVSYNEDFCGCGTEVVDSKTDDRFCCALGDGTFNLQTQPCQTVTVKGKVLDSNTLDSLRGHVKFFNNEKRLNFEIDTLIITAVTPKVIREYSLPIAQGEIYDIEVSSLDPGFEVLQLPSELDTRSHSPGDIIQMDFELDPIDPNCNTNFPPTSVTVQHNPCESRLSIQWEEYDCNVAKYHLLRGTSAGSGSSIAILGPNTMHFEDNDVDPDETFFYTLEVELSNPTLNNGQKVSGPSEEGFGGDPICLELCPNKDFCIDNGQGKQTLIATCDAQNKLTSADCEGIVAPGAICVNVREGGVLQDASCTTKKSCKDVGVGFDEQLTFPNILGMFYALDPAIKENLCLGTETERNYCYHDIYDSLNTESDPTLPGHTNPFATTVDRCINCNSELTCFDYKSDDACTLDNCVLGSGQGCQWEESISTFGEFGEGICYQDDDTSTNNCDECSGAGLCPDSICTKLGACYATENQDACNPCKQPSSTEPTPTTCENYQTRATCIGFAPDDTPFDIPGLEISAETFIDSNDKCNLGVCKWDTSTNTCYKDGDDDSLTDCGANNQCRSDTEPPVTDLNAPPFFSTTTDNILDFEITDITYGNVQSIDLYMCVDTQNTCHPQKRQTVTINNDDEFLFSPVLDLPQNTDDSYYIRYFSIDTYKNIEELKIIESEIDTVLPIITISDPAITPNLNDETVSDVEIRISTSEFSLCDVSFSQLTLTTTPVSGFPEQGVVIQPNDDFILESETLDDGVYQVDVSCEDNKLNPATGQKAFIIDTNNQITSISPFDEILDIPSITLEITTLNDQFGKTFYNCEYQTEMDTFANPFGNPINPTAPLGQDFTYQKSLNLPDGYHTVDVHCYDTDGSEVDSITTIFSIDTTFPEVSLTYETQSGIEPFDNNQIYLGSTIIGFTCNDNLANFNNLGPFGCGPSDIRFCFGTEDRLCDIDPTDTNQQFKPGDLNAIPRLISTGNLCYAATDKHNDNFDNPVCVFANVDNDVPILSNIKVNNIPYDISDPNFKLIFNNQAARITGNWQDRFGKVIISLDNEDKTRNDPRGHGTFTFSPVALQENALFPYFLSARDNAAINGHNVLVPPIALNIGHDRIPPLISNPFINDDEVNLAGNSIEEVKTKSHAEYLKPINFSFRITDPSFTQEIKLSSVRVDIAFEDLIVPQTGCSTQGRINLQSVGNNQFVGYTTGCLEVGNYSIRVQAEDRLDNFAQKEYFFKVRDTEEASTNISVFKEGTNIPVSTLTSGINNINRYDVKLNSSEPLSQIEEFLLSFTDVIGTLQEIQITLAQDDATKQFWKGKLIVVKGGVFTRLNNIQGDFVLKAKDINQVPTESIEEGDTILIDTFGPLNPPIFFTLEDDETLFTNNQDIFVTGHESTDQPDVGIQIMQSTGDTAFHIANAQTFNTISETSPLFINPFMTALGQAQLGETIISIDQTSMTIFDPLSRFDSVGHYFNFSAPRRFTGQNYEITGINSFSTELKEILFSPPFEGSFSAIAHPIYVQNRHAQPGWFGVNIPLIPGSNFFRVAARDSHGNLGGFSNLHHIIFENRLPSFSNELPRDGSIISENRTRIEIIVENKTPLQSHFMTIADSEFIPSLVTENEITKMVHIIADQHGLGEGLYEVYVNATDVAGNVDEFDWRFEINVGVPSTPDVLPEGFISDTTPLIRIEFDSTEDIHLTNVTLKNSTTEIDLTDDLKTGQTAPNSFTHQVTTSLPDGLYSIDIKANKTLSIVEGTLTHSNDGSYPGNSFIIDSTPPNINVSTTHTTNQGHVFVAVNISEENLLSTNITGNAADITTTLLTGIPLTEDSATGMLKNTAFRINLSTGSNGNKEILIRVIDKAENTNIGRAVVLFDNNTPTIQVNVQHPPLLNNRFTNETTFSINCGCSDGESGCNLPSAEKFFKINNGPFTSFENPVDLNAQIGNHNTNVTFKCQMRDLAGSLGIAEYNITVIREGPVIHVIRPRYGGTHDRITPIEIETDQPSTCTLHEFRDSPQSNIFFNLNNQHTRLISSMDLGPNFADPARTIEYFIKCTNDYEQLTVAREFLLIDTRPLNIIEANLSKGTLVSDNLHNTLQIKTNLESQCRFAVNAVKSPPSFPIDLLPFSISDTFTTQQEIDHDFGRNGLINVFVNCFDRTEKVVTNGAGWIFTFIIDVELPIQIQKVGVVTDDQKRTISKGLSYLTQDKTPTLFVDSNKQSIINDQEACQFNLGLLQNELSTNIETELDAQNHLIYKYSLPLIDELDDDEHNIGVVCQSGLDRSTATINFIVDTTAPDPPELIDPAALLAIEDNDLITNDNFTLPGTVDDDTALVDIFIDGSRIGNVTPQNNAFSKFINISSFGHDDSFVIIAKAFDELGNGPSDESNPITIMLDLISNPPTMNPLPGFTLTGRVNINGSTEPDSEVLIYSGTEDKIIIFQGRANSQGDYNFEVEGVPLGTNVITVTSIDIFNNPESTPSAPQTIIYDINPPQLIVRSPDNGDSLNQQNIVIDLQIRDNFEVDSDSLTISVNNHEITPGNISIQENPNEPSITVAANHKFTTRGTKTITLQIADTAGNTLSRTWQVSAQYPPACIDGIDNDNDGKIDQGQDLGCCGVEDDDETDYTGPSTQCSDGVDNEGDGKTDYCFDLTICDKHCSCKDDDDEGPIPTQCNDEVDNDGDGLIDFCAEATCDTGCNSADDDNETDFVLGPTLLGFTLDGLQENDQFISRNDALIGFSFDRPVRIESLKINEVVKTDLDTRLSTTNQQSFFYNATILADQTRHIFQVHASTTGGDTVRSFSFTVDRQSPTITLNKNIDTSLNKRTDIRLTGQFQEPFLDNIFIQRILLPTEINQQINPKTFETLIAIPTGSQVTIPAMITDLAENIAQDSIIFSINTQPPALTIDPLPVSTKDLPLVIEGTSLINHQVLININNQETTVTTDNQGRFILPASTNNGLQDQFTNILNISVQNEFESRSEVIHHVILDQEPPELIIRSPDNQDIGNFDELNIILDDLTGIDFSTFTLSHNGESLTHTVDSSNNAVQASLQGFFRGIPVPIEMEVNVNDILGNPLEEIWSFTLSNGPRITFLNPPGDQNFVNDTIPFIKIKVEDFDQGSVRAKLFDGPTPLDLVKIILPAQGEFIFYPHTPLQTEHAYTFQVRATRSLISQSVVTKQIIVDTVRPLITIDRSSLNQETNENSLTLTGNFQEKNPASITYQVRGESGNPIDTGSILPMKTSSTQGIFIKPNINMGPLDEQINITVLLRDEAGNTAKDRVSLLLDTQPPTVSVHTSNSIPSSTGNSELETRYLVDEDATVSYILNGQTIRSNIQAEKNDIFFRPVTLIQSGMNELAVKATDEAGNSANHTATIFFDTHPPQFSQITPQNPTDNLQPEIKALIEDDQGLVNATVIIDGQLAFFQNIPNQAKTHQLSFTPQQPLADGQTHNLRIIAFDMHNNLGISTPINFVTDTSLPSFEQSIPSEDQQINTAQPLLQIDYNDPVQLLSAKIDQNDITFQTTNNIHFTNQISPPLIDGPHELLFSAKRLNQVGSIDQRRISFIVDTTNPLVNIIGIQGSSETVPVIHEFQATVIVHVEDDHLKHLQVTSPLSNLERSFTDTPSTESFPTESFMVQLVPGTNTIQATATDQAGNIENTFFTIIVDRELPLLQIDPLPAQTATLPITLSGTTLENTQVFITINGQTTSVASNGDGDFTFEASQQTGLIDQFDNKINITVFKSDEVRNEQLRSIIVDQQGPEIILKSPDSNDVGNFHGLEIVLDDFTSIDFSSIELFNHDSELEFTLDPVRSRILVSLDGFFIGARAEMSILLRARDVLGNELVESWSFFLDNGPSIAFLHPAGDNVFVNSSQPFLSFRVENFDAGSVRARLEDNVGSSVQLIPVVAQGPGVFTFFPLTNLNTQVTYRFFVSANRSGISQTSLSKDIIVDGISPTLFLDKSILRSPTNAQSITLQGNFVESEPSRISYSIKTPSGQLIDEGTIPFTITSENTGSFSKEAIPVGTLNQEVSITVNLEDKAGNKAEDAHTISIDRISPNVLITDPLSGFSASQSNLIVSARVDKDSLLTFILNDDIVDTNILAAPQEVIDILFNLRENGENIIRVNATDRAGNRNSESITVFFDNTAPVITNIQPTNPISTLLPTITATIQDTTGLANVSVLIDDEEISFIALTQSEQEHDLSVTITDALADQAVHTIQIQSQDILGNTALSEVVSFLVDTTLPSFKESNPSFEYVRNPSPPINFEYFDAVEIISSTIDQEAITFDTINNKLFTHQVTDLLVDGEHEFSFSARRLNQVGNVEDRTVTFTVDSTIPFVNIIGLEGSTDAAPVIHVFDATIQIHVEDEHLKRLRIINSGSVIEKTYVDAQGLESFLSETFPLSLHAGTNIVTATAFDEAGNTQSDTFTIIVDRVLPLLVVDDLPEQTASLPLTISGTTIPFKEVFLTINGQTSSTPANANGIFAFDATEQLGLRDQFINEVNVSVFKSAEIRTEHIEYVVLDRQSPITTLRSPDNNDVGNFGRIEIALDDFTAVDYSTIELRNHNNPLAIEIDPVSQRIFASLDGFFAGVAVDLEITLRVQDILGNLLEESWSFTLDNGPQITFLYPFDENNFVNSTKPFLKVLVEDFDQGTVEAHLTDNFGSLVSLVPISTLGPGIFVFFPQTDLDPSRQYLFEVFANRSGISRTKVGKSILLDLNSPSLLLDTSVLPSPTNLDSVSVRGTFFESQPEVISYTLSGANQALIDTGTIDFVKTFQNGGSYEKSGISLGVQDQSVTLDLTLMDKAGNKDHVTHTMIVDREIPQVRVTQPHDGLITSEQNIIVTAEVNKDTSLIVLLNDNVIRTGISATKDVPLNIPVNLVQNGANELMINATDSAGNRGSNTITISLDNTAPVITNIQPTNPQPIPTPTISARIRDESGIGNATVFIDGQEVFFTNIPSTSKDHDLSFTLTDPLTDQATHTIQIQAQDIHGNRRISETVNFLVDTSLPNLIQQFPIPGSIIKDSTPQLEISLEDEVVISSATLNANSITFNSADKKQFSHQVVISLPEGDNVFIFEAQRSNGIGNSLQHTTNFELDTIAPSLNIAGIASGNAPPSQNTVIHAFTTNLIGSVSDKNIESLTISGGKTFYEQITFTSPQFRIGLELDSGENTISVIALDKAGNINSTSIDIFVDRENPPLTINPLPTVANRFPIQLTGTTLPNTEVIISINENPSPSSVTSLGDGSFSLNLDASKGMKDEFTNSINVSVKKSEDVRTESLHNVILDTLPPKVLEKSPNQGDRGDFNQLRIFLDDFSAIDSTIRLMNHDQPLDYSFDPEENTITSSLAGFFKGIPIPMQIVLEVQDTLGNAMTEQWTFTLDNGPLITFINPPPGEKYVNNTVPELTFRVEQFDTNSVRARLENKQGAALPIIPIINGNLFTYVPVNELIPEQSYFLKVSANRSGISQTRTSKEITVDNIQPIIVLNKNNLFSPTNAYYTLLEGNYLERNPSSIEFTINSPSSQLIDSGPLLFQKHGTTGIFGPAEAKTGEQEQEISIQTSIADRAGNKADDTFSILLDRTAPVIDLIEPTATVHTADSLLPVRATSNEDVTLDILLNNNLKEQSISLEKDATLSLDILLTSSGENTIVLQAKDAAGNSGNATFTVFFDNTAPIIQNISPNNPVNTQTPLIGASIADDEGIASITIFIDNQVIVSNTIPSAPKEFILLQPIQNPLEDRKLHNLVIRSTDIHGNIANSPVVQFLVDTSIPTFTESNPSQNSHLNTPTPAVSVEYLEGVLIENAALDSSSITFTQQSPNIHTHQVQTALEEGTHLLEISAKRSSGIGNADQRSIEFIVDTTPPSIAIKGVVGKKESEPLINQRETKIAFSFSDEHMKSITLLGSLNDFTEQIQDSQGIEADPNKEVVVALHDGLNTIEVVAEDQAGNINTSELKILVDTEGATINAIFVKNSITLETNNRFKVSSATINISGSYSDNPIHEIKLGQKKATINAAAKTFKFDEIPLSAPPNTESEHNLLLIITDSAGNIKNKSITVIKDEKGPEITLLEPRSRASINRRPLFQIQTSESAKNCLFKYKPATLPKEETFIQKTETTFEIIPNFQLALGDNPVSITCLDSLNNPSSSFLLNMYIENELPAGIPLIKEVVPKDAIALEDQHHYLLFNINQNNQAETTLTIVAEDDSEGVRCKFGTSPDNLNHKTVGYDNFNFSLSPQSSLFPVTVGEHTYHVQCEDRAGKNSQIFQLRLSVDPDFPVIINPLFPNVTFVNNLDHDFNEEIEISTVNIDASCKIDFIGGGLQRQPMTSQLVQGHRHHTINTLDTDSGLLGDDTTYTYEVRCDDKLGNLVSNKRNIIFTTDYSIIQPNITLPNNESTINREIIVKGTAESASTVQLLVNNHLRDQSTLTATTVFEFNNVTLQSGNNVLTIISTDKAGNIASTTKNIFFSSQGPSVQIISPLDNMLLGELSTVLAKITSDIGADFVNSTINVIGPNGPVAGSILSTDIQKNLLILTYSVPIIENGEYSLEVVGFDTRGRENRNFTTITIDRNLPIITISQPSPQAGSIQNKSPTTIEGLVRSRVEIQPNILINLQTTPAQSQTISENNNIYDFIFNNFRLQEGRNTYNVTATNEFGIQGSALGDITLDTRGPTAEIDLE